MTSRTTCPAIRHTPKFCATLLAFCFASQAQAATFIGSGGGAIPDNSPTGATVSFNVTGMSGQLDNVSVSVGLTHTWMGDVTATLISPNGLARLKLFGRVGAGVSSTAGRSANFDGLYTFDDQATQDLWVNSAGLPSSSIVPPAGYRTSTAGVPARGGAGGCSSYLRLAFGGLRPSQMNGTWTLVVTDSSQSDVGTVNAGISSLTLTSITEVAETPLFRSGMEDNESTQAPPSPLVTFTASNVRGSCTPAIGSLSGGGLTDYILVRSVNNQFNWSVRSNDLTAGGTELPVFVLGSANDSIMLGDYDGDGISDAAVWTPGNVGRFKIRRSSRPGDAPLELAAGVIGDNPAVAADYDGDRVTDFAWFRSGTISSPSSTFNVRLSSTGLNLSRTIADTGGGFPFALRDITGDGNADLGVQTPTGSVARFTLLNVSSGSLIGSSFEFGLGSDFIIPGQFTGSAATDITISRNKTNPATSTQEKSFATRDTQTTTIGADVFLGIPGDVIVPGDYDGDGLVDFAIWRASTNAGQSKFLVRRSSNPASPLEVFFGAVGDYPANNWDVH